MCGLFQFPSPSFILVSGSSQSGKSTWTRKLISSPDMFELPVSKFCYCYGVDREELSGLGDSVEVHKGLPNNVMLDNFIHSNPGHKVLILDDLLTESTKNPDLLHSIATRMVSHHCMTCIYLTQSLFAVPKTVRSNANVIVLFKSENDIQSVSTLGRQLFASDRYRHFMEVYTSLFDQPYSYLCIVLHPRAHRELKLCTDVFSPYPTVFLPNNYCL